MGLTAFSAVLSLILCGFTLTFTRTIRRAVEVRAQATEIQNRQITRQMMFSELGEYAKKHPDLQALFQPAQAPTTAPAKAANP